MLLTMLRVVPAPMPKATHCLINRPGGCRGCSFREAGYTSGQCPREQALGNKDELKVSYVLTST
jgi:hypothetical protein